MLHEGISACIIPTSDSHQSEYTAAYAKFREWVSGFTGSAGTLVVTADEAGLWTDSRYFLQAQLELEGSGITLYKCMLPGVPTYQEWLIEHKLETIGIDGTVFSAQEVQKLHDAFAQLQIRLKTGFRPQDAIWEDRPSKPANPLFLFHESHSGESTKAKLMRIRMEMQKTQTDFLLLSMLDEIAWAFNIRGCDIEYNPVVIAHACIGLKEAWLFIDAVKIPPVAKATLDCLGIHPMPYEDFSIWVKAISGAKVQFDPDHIGHEFVAGLSESNTFLKMPSPIARMKGVKNKTEIEGFRKAMIKDGVALIKLRRWMEETLKNGSLLTEYTLGDAYAEFRSSQEGYFCESFAPIVAKDEHGAIVHYEATPESAYVIGKNGALLMDTGGQYLDGTTDITRSLYSGRVPKAYKMDYTCLLQGLIALSSAKFPVGTRGTQLDILARSPLWQRNINFLHGTGHGVGHFLNVHEGPHSIRMNENPTPLQPGMVVTNEPGIYRTGRWGIRLENMLLVRRDKTSAFGEYLSFETLTLFPFETNCLIPEIMSKQEIQWLNTYHERIYNTLAPLLNASEKRWLKAKTKPFSFKN